MAGWTGSISDRVISMGNGLASIPERLLLAHSRGEVLFIAGAGVSMPAGLPNFRELAIKVYQKLDLPIFNAISKIPPAGCKKCWPSPAGLDERELAEVNRFCNDDFDVALGMLERRMEGKPHIGSNVRQIIADELRGPNPSPAPIHHALMSLADRGAAVTIVTTNFDLLLEKAHRRIGSKIQSYALGGIPRPSRRDDFSGVLHIHGALDKDIKRTSDLIITDQDFGEFYLRRRVVPDFIYDAARLYNLVLIGYSANDPPMRYLFNAVDADETRFTDLKERFSFVPSKGPNKVELADWDGRGITPIPYDPQNGHAALLQTLERWAKLSAINGRRSFLDAELKRTVKTSRAVALDSDRDLFDHLFRRCDSNERVRLSSVIAKQKPDIGWLEAAITIAREKNQENRK